MLDKFQTGRETLGLDIIDSQTGLGPGKAEKIQLTLTGRLVLRKMENLALQ